LAADHLSFNDRTAALLDSLDIAWLNIGTASVDLELPDVIAYADIESQWETYKYSLLAAIENETFYPNSVEIVDLPKDRLAVRPLARLEISHRLVYEALIVAIAPLAKKAVSRRVYSNRWWLRRQRFLSPVGTWIRMQRAARTFHLGNPNLLLASTDVSSFFEHIDIDILIDDLRRLGAPAWVLEPLGAFLAAFNGLSSAWGIPQGSDMSGVLANIYLASFDSEIRRSGLRHFRYSDDTYIFGSDWSVLRGVLVDANRVLRHRHLNLAAAKTKILEGEDIMKHLEDKEKDAINYGVDADLPGVDRLVRDLFERATSIDPPNSRDVKFCLTKLARLKDDHAVDWLLSNLTLVPHLAREVLVYLDRFIDGRPEVKHKAVDFLQGKEVARYPYAQQHLLIFLMRNDVGYKRATDAAWTILLDRNAEVFVREMAARYLGLHAPPGESGRLKQEYQTESSSRVKRALLVACYESRQCSQKWLATVAVSDPALRVTAEYLQRNPIHIPRPAIERPPWR
jgi:hypothetical protein